MHAPFEKGLNPRSHLKNHRERGPNKHYYTAADVAALLGVSVKTVHNMKRRTNAQRLDITSLESICKAYARKFLK